MSSAGYDVGDGSLLFFELATASGFFDTLSDLRDPLLFRMGLEFSFSWISMSGTAD